MVSLHCLTDWYSFDEDMQIYEPHKLSYIQKWKGIDYVFNWNWGFATSAVEVLPN